MIDVIFSSCRCVFFNSLHLHFTWGNASAIKRANWIHFCSSEKKWPVKAVLEQNEINMGRLMFLVFLCLCFYVYVWSPSVVEKKRYFAKHLIWSKSCFRVAVSYLPACIWEVPIRRNCVRGIEYSKSKAQFLPVHGSSLRMKGTLRKKVIAAVKGRVDSLTKKANDITSQLSLLLFTIIKSRDLRLQFWLFA